MASCPGCKTFETLWFVGDVMVPTQRFAQRDGRVYNNCGSDKPLRLLLRFKERGK